MPRPYTPNDKWSRKAAEEGYRARSVYKLMELDQKFRLLKHGMTVLDLGAAPGSWAQYASQRIGPKGVLIGLDLQEMEPIAENVHLYQQDITDHDGIRSIMEKEGVDAVDLVISDLAPATSGIRDVDQWRSIELSQSVLECAHAFLKPKGICVMKILRGADFDAFLRDMKKEWNGVRTFQAKASRDRSKEIYVLAAKR